jgi:hypothetical protein
MPCGAFPNMRFLLPKIFLLSILSLATLNSASQAQTPDPAKPQPTMQPKKVDATAIANYTNYRDVVQQTVNMVQDSEAQKLAASFNLNVLNVTWEDTGRYKNSAVGPNISDMTIQVQQQDPRTGKYELSLMPVIRRPNFSDETADIPLDRFFLLTGNEKGKDLQKVSLKEFLGDFRKYLHTPGSWKGDKKSLLAERDTHALVSAQAAFLPIPKQGKAEFNPVLFNYQSYSENPAVLTILVTREGTSSTIIDNKRDGFEAGRTWGQRLFFNKNGQRASLTGQRISDFKSEGSSVTTPSVQAAGEEGLNMVMLIQVPLKQKERPRPTFSGADMLPLAMPAPAAAVNRASNVEAAVIGHGKVEGPFTEIDNLAIERDPRFPVRVTIQFYKATDNGVVSEKDMREISKQIERVYADADYVGSLVTNGETKRPTEYEGSKVQPPGWWNDFWLRYEQNTGQSREDAIRMLRKLRGDRWMPRSQQELEQQIQITRPE